MRTFLMLVLAGVLAGCSKPAPQATYLLLAVGTEAYRVNTVSGDVSRVTAQGVIPVKEEPQPLAVGSLVRLEDGRVVRYEGKGKLVPAVTVKNW
jgi:uncharacterized lipoprotein YmbA